MYDLIMNQTLKVSRAFEKKGTDVAFDLKVNQILSAPDTHTIFFEFSDHRGLTDT